MDACQECGNDDGPHCCGLCSDCIELAEAHTCAGAAVQRSLDRD